MSNLEDALKNRLKAKKPPSEVREESKIPNQKKQVREKKKPKSVPIIENITTIEELESIIPNQKDKTPEPTNLIVDENSSKIAKIETEIRKLYAKFESAEIGTQTKKGMEISEIITILKNSESEFAQKIIKRAYHNAGESAERNNTYAHSLLTYTLQALKDEQLI